MKGLLALLLPALNTLSVSPVMYYLYIFKQVQHLGDCTQVSSTRIHVECGWALEAIHKNMDAPAQSTAAI